MLRFIVYEDNVDSLERLVSIVHKTMAPYEVEYKIDKYNAYNKSIEDIINSNMDQKIYILDIEVPKVSGLQIAAKVRDKDWKSIVIFVTSHPECKNDIFYSRLLALDYISKYNTYDKRLQQTLEKAVHILNKSRVLTYKYNYITYRIDFDDILYIEKVSYDRKCIIYTENGFNLEIAGNIKEILSLLDNSFYMSNKSCIVNLDKVLSVDTSKGIITLKNNEKLDTLSNRTKKAFAERFMNYDKD